MHVIGVPIYQFLVSYFQGCPSDTQFSTNLGHLTHCGLESSYHYCPVGSAVAMFGSLIAMLLYPPLQRSWKRGILVSPCPSVRPSVRLWTESCPLCIFHKKDLSDPFIFTHLVNLLHIFKNKFSTKVVNLHGLVWPWNNGLINIQIRLSTTLTYSYYCIWLIYSMRCWCWHKMACFIEKHSSKN